MEEGRGGTLRQREKGNERKCSEDRREIMYDMTETWRNLRWMEKNEEEQRGQSSLLHQCRKHH